MKGIKDKIAIVGMGCTKFGENWDKSVDDLIIDAAYEAFEDAGIESKDIEAAWYGTMHGGQSGMALARPLQFDRIPITRVENFCATGTDTLRNACYGVASGAYDIVLALGVEKLKDSGLSGLPNYRCELGEITHTYRDQSWTAPARYAMMAVRYFERYGLSPEEGKKMLARIPVKNHHNGTLSPKAHFQREVTLEQVLNARIIAWPLGLYDCCGVSDGAAAAIVTRADMAKNFRPDPIYVKALTIATSPQSGKLTPSFDYTYIEETYRAGMVAYAEAGIKNPREEISMAEVHDCFSITEVVIYEDLQFCPKGRAKEDIEAGTFALDGKLPVNTDGGLKCFGHPIGASGLRMIYEVYKQLQGKAGPRQIKNPKLGLIHNVGGQPPNALVGILIAGNELG